MALAGILRYGTSSWSEKSWAGSFYPDGMAPGDYLGHYATQFRTVEADVTYYRIPDKRLVSGWERRTPEGFVLSAKFPRSIVHAGPGAQPDPERLLLPEAVAEDSSRFLESMALLGEKCGPLILQFPYFNKQAFSGPGPFLERLDAFLENLPKDFRYGVELRNRNWLKPKLTKILKRHATALVLVDLVYMPDADELAEQIDLITTDFSYLRLIGDRKAVEAKTQSFDRIVIDQKTRVTRWSKLLKQVLERVPVAYAYANNHYAGHGPTTIRQLARMLPREMIE